MNPATAQRRARRLSFLTAVALVATAFFVPASTAAAPPADVGFRDGRYIVTFADAPVAEYSGYVEGLPATEPSRAEAQRPFRRGPVAEAPDQQARRGAGQGRRDQDLRLHRHQQRRRRAS